MAANPDFKSLWDKLVAAAAVAGDARVKSALVSNESRKEWICRRLGVVCDADVTRVTSSMRNSDS